MTHLGELLGERLLALGDHVALSCGLRRFKIHRLLHILEILCHLLGDLFALADEMRRAAELVPRRVPEKVEQQEILLAGLRRKTCPASYHLAVEAPHLRRAQHNDAVHARAVPALREQHGVAKHRARTRSVKGGKHLGAVAALAVYLHRVHAALGKQPRKFPARGDERQKHDRLASGAGLRHLAGDLPEIRVKRRAELPGLEIAVLHPHAREIERKRDRLRRDAAEKAVFDRARELILIRQRLEERPQIAPVAAVRRRGDAEYLRAGKVLEHALVAVREHMMRLVHDDVGEIVRRKRRETRLAHERLHAADGHAVPGIPAALLGLLHAASESRGTAELVRRLVEQLAPVRKNEHPPSSAHRVCCHGGKHDRLAAPRGQHEQRPIHALPFVFDGSAGLLLIGPQLHQNAPGVQLCAAAGAAGAFSGSRNCLTSFVWYSRPSLPV